MTIPNTAEVVKSRIREIVKDAEPSTGNTFPHWIGNHCIFVRKTKVILAYSRTSSSRPGQHAVRMTGPRDDATANRVIAMVLGDDALAEDGCKSKSQK